MGPNEINPERKIHLVETPKEPVVRPLTDKIINEFDEDWASMQTPDEKQAMINEIKDRMQRLDPGRYAYMLKRGQAAADRSGIRAGEEVMSTILETYDLEYRQAKSYEKEANPKQPL